ncbi:MAG: multicopper oxidase domain-containing protein [Acidobacteria bacterium]|nr:multicopper oxidase domain-containing protein [Acidobacteriota bacterium]
MRRPSREARTRNTLRLPNVQRAAMVAALAGAALLPFAALGATREFTLTAAATAWEIAPGQKVTAWAYNASVPGPELRVSAGDTIRVKLVNHLPEATTIHWHGVPVPNGMDGVPGISAPVVQRGEQFTYEFPAPEPGTYWYHPHADAAAQIARGLYGLLIVDPPSSAPRTWDREVSLVIGEFSGTMGAMGGGMGMGGGMNPSGMMMGTLLINGKAGPHVPDLRFRKGERVLFRMVNTGNMVHPMHLHGMSWTVTATDGFAAPAPYRKDTLPINAGERYDAVLDASNPGSWMLHCHNLQHVGDGASGATGLALLVVVEP